MRQARFAAHVRHIDVWQCWVARLNEMRVQVMAAACYKRARCRSMNARLQRSRIGRCHIKSEPKTCLLSRDFRSNGGQSLGAIDKDVFALAIASRLPGMLQLLRSVVGHLHVWRSGYLAHAPPLKPVSLSTDRELAEMAERPMRRQELQGFDRVSCGIRLQPVAAQLKARSGATMRMRAINLIGP